MTQGVNTFKLRAVIPVGGERWAVVLPGTKSLWRLSLEHKFYLAAAIALAALLTFGVLASDVVASVKRHSDAADHARAMLVQLSVLTADLLHMEHLEHDLLSGGNLTHRAAYIAANRKAATDITALERLIPSDSLQLPRLRRMAALVETQYASLQKVNEDGFATPPPAVASQWVSALDAVQDLVGTMGQVEQLAVERSRGAVQVSIRHLRNWSIIIAIAAVFLGAWLLTLVRLDVSEKVSERTAKLASDNEALRELSARIEAAREEERLRIAREMHDELGSTLTVLKLDLMGNVNRRQGSSGVGREQRRKSVELVDAALQTVNEIVSELRPHVLDKFGLWEALIWKVQQFENWVKIPCHLVMAADLPRPSNELATSVFRVVEEALTNVARHANASRVDVSVVLRSDTLEITIADNGCGITTEKILGQDAFGLLSMHERARLRGGEFHISGETGRGTTARLLIPLTQIHESRQT